MALSFKVRVNADIEDISSIPCQQSNQVTNRFVVQTQTIAKVVAVFNTCSELKLRPRVI